MAWWRCGVWGHGMIARRVGRRRGGFSAKLKCLFALTVASSGLQLEVVLRKGQRLLDRGPYTGACTEAALAPHATAAHRTAPPSPAVPINVLFICYTRDHPPFSF